MKRLQQGITMLVIVVVTIAGPTLRAGAHTGFESSDPADGAIVDAPVEVITIAFTGAAEPTGDGFTLLDPSGEARAPTEVSTDDGRTWILRFDPPIAGGAAGLRWMVKAPDGHPIDGAFSFTVPELPPVAIDEPPTVTDAPAPPGKAAAPDDAGDPATEAAPAVPDDTGDPATGAPDTVELDEFLDASDDAGVWPDRLAAAGRLLTLLGSFVAIGGLVFAATSMRGARGDVRYVLLLVRRAGVLVILGAAVEFAAQIVIEDAGRWSALGSPSAMGDVLWSTVGVATALRVAGGLAIVSGARMDTGPASSVVDPAASVRDLVGAVPAGGDVDSSLGADASVPEPPPSEPLDQPSDRPRLADRRSSVAVVGAVALVVAHLFDGHTVTEGNRILTGLVAAVHVVAGAIWAGGVFMLAAVLWHRSRQGRPLRARQLAIRFSVVATIALVAVGVAGVALSVVVLDSASELWSTEWGRTLLVKTSFVVLAAIAGGYNHKVLVPALDATPDDPDLAQRFRFVVTAEAAALLAVALATAVLMGAAT